MNALTISSFNANHSSFNMKSILEQSSDAILCIQEPAFIEKPVPSTSSSVPDVLLLLPSHRDWICLCPPDISPNLPVVTYVHRRWTPLQPRLLSRYSPPHLQTFALTISGRIH